MEIYTYLKEELNIHTLSSTLTFQKSVYGSEWEAVVVIWTDQNTCEEVYWLA